MSGLHIVVGVQRVIDPSLGIRIDEGTASAVSPRSEIACVLNRVDRAALEAALRLGSAADARSPRAARVTALTVGPPSDEAILRYCLARGADDAVRVWDETLDVSDAAITARILARAVADLRADVVICGKRSLGRGSGQVPAGMAEILDLPQITGVIDLAWADDRCGLVALQRLERGNRAQLECPLPVLVAVEADAFPLRYVSWNAQRRVDRPVRSVGTATLGAMAPATDIEAPLVETIRVTRPRPRTKKVVAPAATGAALVSMLMRGGGVAPKSKASGPLTGTPEHLAGKIIEFLQEKGFLSKQ
jgi:electron transfer flavoprotein beta subunit